MTNCKKNTNYVNNVLGFDTQLLIFKESTYSFIPLLSTILNVCSFNHPHSTELISRVQYNEKCALLTIR